MGADVISRIEVALTDEVVDITAAILNAIDNLINEISKVNQMSAFDIEGVVIAGNTVMLSLLTSISVKPLSHAPFVCERLFGETVKAKELGLSSLSPDVKVYLPNCVAAFEGVGISMAMSSKSGAIDRVEIVDGNIFSHTIDDVKPCGICGSGIIDAIACLLKMGIIDETGYLEESFVIESTVSLEPQDIRAVQLSKSAICSGILTLLNEADVCVEDVESVYVAGGFGSYINIENAGFICLLPRELVPKVHVIGNAALSGASMMLLNPELRQKMMQFIKTSSIIELSSNNFFMDSYIENMLF